MKKIHKPTLTLKFCKIQFFLFLLFCIGFGSVVNAQINVNLLVNNPCINVSIENLKKSENNSFDVLPNPNNGTFVIGVKSDKVTEKVELKIYNSMGVLILGKEFKPAGLQYYETINADNLPAGIYLIHLYDGVTIYSEKLIINK